MPDEPKKSPGDLGGRGRRHTTEERTLILELIDEAVGAGARQHRACEVLGVSPRTLQRWRPHGGGEDRRRGPHSKPAKALSPEERKRALDIANSPEYRDLSPHQIIVRLADEGLYVASESTFYRLLREEKQLAHRHRSRPATPSLPEARDWVRRFVAWYNTEHRHSALRFVTPDQRHFGQETAILEHRHQVYQRARQQNPERWSRDTRDWTPAGDVYLNPRKDAETTQLDAAA